ncbi:MAG: hypothetical protein IPK24_21520 [Kineosporiaceae bacterium]|nr:hypothetical protein [Kineosporiaceae bacterium]MBK8078068.1 hypothetical protein [Kineosporiaceae bacterium]
MSVQISRRRRVVVGALTAAVMVAGLLVALRVIRDESVVQDECPAALLLDCQRQAVELRRFAYKDLVEQTRAATPRPVVNSSHD